MSRLQFKPEAGSIAVALLLPRLVMNWTRRIKYIDSTVPHPLSIGRNSEADLTDLFLFDIVQPQYCINK